MTSRILLFAISLFLIGCGAPTAPVESPAGPSIAAITAEDRAAITKLSEGFGVAMVAADWDTLAAAYTPDAILYPSDAPAVTGHDEIKKSFAGFPPIKAFDAKIEELEGYGDLAYLRGSAVMTMALPDGTEAKASGKYIEIYRKQADGSWLMDRDIYNMDAPAGG